MKQIPYYPGCSLKGTGIEYHLSTLAVLKALGIEMKEIKDWNCCGASAAHSVAGELAVGLNARNFSKVAELGNEVAVPCSACYNNMRSAAHEIKSKSPAGIKAAEISGLDPEKVPDITHLLELFLRPEIKKRLQQIDFAPELKGLPVVCYYGCLTMRPAKIVAFGNSEHPSAMEDILRTAGIAARDWSYQTDCCGAALAIPRTDMTERLVRVLVREAKAVGAEAIITACPMCQANLDSRQEKNNNLPVLYFTELLGLTMGLPEIQDCLQKHHINTSTIANRVAVAAGAGGGA